MGFLRDQASRLIRTKWIGNADLLAEELYAIFTGDVPIVFDSPVTIINETGEPAINVRDFGDSDASIRIEKRPLPKVDLPDIPPLDDSGAGRVQIRYVYPDGDEGWEGDGGDPPDTNPGTGSPIGQEGGGGFPGVVVSGTEDEYLVDVYEGGLSEAPTQRTVTQLSIASGEQIPAGTWALVGKVGDEYFMQVPVWLDDLP